MKKRYITLMFLALTLSVTAACNGDPLAPRTNTESEQEEPKPGEGDGTALVIPNQQVFFG